MVTTKLESNLPDFKMPPFVDIAIENLSTEFKNLKENNCKLKEVVYKNEDGCIKTAMVPNHMTVFCTPRQEPIGTIKEKLICDNRKSIDSLLDLYYQTEFYPRLTIEWEQSDKISVSNDSDSVYSMDSVYSIFSKAFN